MEDSSVLWWNQFLCDALCPLYILLLHTPRSLQVSPHCVTPGGGLRNSPPHLRKACTALRPTAGTRHAASRALAIIISVFSGDVQGHGVSGCHVTLGKAPCFFGLSPGRSFATLYTSLSVEPTQGWAVEDCPPADQQSRHLAHSRLLCIDSSCVTSVKS